MGAKGKTTSLESKMLKWSIGLVLIFLSVCIPYLLFGFHQDADHGILKVLLPSLLYTFMGGIVFSVIYFIHARIWQASWPSTLISVSLAVYLISRMSFIMHWPGASIQRYNSILLVSIGIGVWVFNSAKKKKGN